MLKQTILSIKSYRHQHETSFFSGKTPFVRRVGLLSLLILFSVATTVSFSSPLFAKPYAEEDITTRAMAYESILILRRCLVDGNIKTENTKSNLSNESPLESAIGRKYVSWNPAVVNYHPTLKEDNEAACGEGKGATRGALKRLGINEVEFICKMGGKRAVYEGNGTVTDCLEGSGTLGIFTQNITENQINNAVKALTKFTGFDPANPGKEVQYLRSLNVLKYGCFGTSISEAVYNKEPEGKRWAINKYPEGKDYYKGEPGGGSNQNQKPRGGAAKDKGEKGDINCKEYWDRANSFFPAYKTYKDGLTPEERSAEEQAENASTAEAGDDAPTSCAIEGIGWIICPVSTAIAKATDALYGWISNFLKVQPLNMDTSSNDNTMYTAWKGMRNIANVAFVVAFLIIIFSQLSGAGVSNYGVKKMLPRLIVAAILVNISYWVTAIAVDVSNILGSNIYNVLHEGIGLGRVTLNFNVWENIFVWLLSAGAVGVAGFTIGGAIAAGTASAFVPVLLWGGLVILLMAALSLLVAFFILALRQALIIILIVLSPLAFVAFLLPNTEKFFTMWRKSLTTLLIFYPLFSILFGGAYLAGMVIIGSAGGAQDDAAVGLLPILGLAVMAVPLALTPLIIKFSSGVMGTVAGMVNNRSKGLIDRARNVRNRKSGLALNETFAHPNNKNLFARTYRRVQNSKRVDASRQRMIDGVNEEAYVGAVVNGNTGVAARAGGIHEFGESRVRASAVASEAKAQNEAVAAEKILLSKEPMSNLHAMMQDTSGKYSKEKQMAAASSIVERGADSDIHRALDYLGSSQGKSNPASTDMQQQVASDIGSRKPSSLGAGDIASLKTGSYSGTLGDKAASRLGQGKVSAETLATTSKDELELMERAMGAAIAGGDAEVIKNINSLKSDIRSHLGNPNIKQPPAEVARAMEALAR